MNQTLNQQIADLLQKGNKLEAVKITREILNLGLKEAKEYVEAWQAGNLSYEFDKQPKMNQELLAELQRLIANRQKIEAVKLAKESLNLGLKEAKELVDDLEANKPLDLPNLPQNPTIAKADLYSEEFIQQIMDLLFKNQKIAAVKLVVDMQGLSLLTAKEYVDKIEKMI
jgi:ribosomal protein L7/L12